MSTLARIERTVATRLISLISCVELASASGPKSGGTLIVCLTPNRLLQPLTESETTIKRGRAIKRAPVFAGARDELSIKDKGRLPQQDTSSGTDPFNRKSS